MLGALSACALILSGKGGAATDLGATFTPSNGQVQVTINGGTNCWHYLQASTNLFDWDGMTNLFQTNTASAWTDSDATNFQCRFYRSVELTPLDLYVAAPDTNYSYTVLSTNPGTGQTTYVLEMRSQVWLTTNEVNRTLWKHWMIIVKPTGVTNSQSLLYIDGGGNNDAQPTGPDSNLSKIATNTQTIVTQLRMVPNQPLTFVGDTNSSRSEDALIAWTWDKFMRTGDQRWPARLPMTKAAVRAMDTVTAFCASPAGGGLNVDKFVVAGASKRGWTTWTTAAVDKRVIAIVPIVIDVLNVETSMIHHYSAYGFWAPAIQDYVNMGIMNWIGTLQLHALMGIEDPYPYRARFTMPKFLINASGDDFFLPDSSQFYFGDLPGVKYLRYVPNADHSLSGSDAYVSLEAYYQSVLFNTPLPQFSWTLQLSNTVQVLATDLPDVAKLWQATNSAARDFRKTTIGPVAWQSTALTDQGSGVYTGAVSNPAEGWKAFFVELTYNRTGSGLQPLKFTTQVYVVPDTLPSHFPP